MSENSPNLQKLAFFNKIQKAVRSVAHIQIQTFYILVATLCHFELNIFQILRMRIDQKANILQIQSILEYMEHLRYNGWFI